MFTKIYSYFNNNSPPSSPVKVTKRQADQHTAIQQAMKKLRTTTTISVNPISPTFSTIQSQPLTIVVPPVIVQKSALQFNTPPAAKTSSTTSKWTMNSGRSVRSDRSERIERVKRTAAMMLEQQQQDNDELNEINQEGLLFSPRPTKRSKLDLKLDAVDDQCPTDAIENEDEEVLNKRKRKRQEQEEQEEQEEHEEHEEHVAQEQERCVTPLSPKRKRVTFETVSNDKKQTQKNVIASVVHSMVSNVCATSPPKTIPQVIRKRKLSNLKSSSMKEEIRMPELKRSKQNNKSNTSSRSNSSCSSSNNNKTTISNGSSPNSRHSIMGVRSPSYYRSLQKALVNRIGKPGFQAKNCYK